MYELPTDKVPEKKNDNGSPATELKFNHDGTRIYSTFDRQTTSKEENLPVDVSFDLMFDRKQSTKELAGSSTDLSQPDFSMLKVGKHIIQLPLLHSSSQQCRVNEEINNLCRKHREAPRDSAIITQQT